MPRRHIGEWRYSSAILDLSTRYMEVSGQLHASAALHWGRSPGYPLDRRLVRPQNRSGCCGVEKSPLPLLRIEPKLLGRPAHSLIGSSSYLCQKKSCELNTNLFCMYYDQETSLCIQLLPLLLSVC
jgi:hypothetical protein